MKRQLLLALLAAGLAAAPGCADKRDAVPGIRITPSIKTRVTGLHFDTGDCIGLTVTKNGSDHVRNSRRPTTALPSRLPACCGTTT